MFGIGTPELLLVGGLALLLFGPGRLPALATVVGRSLREFRHAVSGIEDRTPSPHEVSPAAVPAAGLSVASPSHDVAPDPTTA